MVRDPISGTGSWRSVLVSHHLYKNYAIEMENQPFEANLISIPIRDFDIILVLDWLSKNHAYIDCHGKKVIIKDSACEEISYQGNHKLKKS